MARVTRPGGRVAVLDTDWGSACVDSAESDIERRLMRFLAERMHRNGYAGRQLPRLFQRAGLDDVRYEALPVPVTGSALIRQILTADKLEAQALAEGALTAGEVRRWRDSLARADAQGGCFFCATVVLVSATRA
jgi:hypothetical protein